MANILVIGQVTLAICLAQTGYKQYFFNCTREIVLTYRLNINC